MTESQSSPPSNQAGVAQPQPEALQSDSQSQPAAQPTSASSSTELQEPKSTDKQPSVSEPAPEIASTEDDMMASNPKQDVEMGGTEADSGDTAAQDGTTAPSDDPAASATAGPSQAPVLSALEAAAAAPTKKDTSLREFLGQMDEYAPIIPDAVTAHYLTLAGLPPPGQGPNHTPPHLARLLALATQKFVSDIAADAYQYARIRNSNNANNPMGAINVSAGLNVANQGQAGGTGGAGAGGGGGGEAAKGKAANAGLHLGVQRAGFGGGGQGGGQGKTVLTMEDLGMAVAEYGATVKRGEFYR